MISPNASFAYFSILTTIYFVMRYFLLDKYRRDKKPNKSLSIGLMVTYLAIMVSLQLSANLSNVKEKCGGDAQIIPALMYTLIPNVFIFGALIVGLLLFPGWKAPFSNTIGYLIVCLPTMEIKDVFNNILVQSSSTNKLLKMVYEDPSIMINQITPSNINVFFNKMSAPENSILNKVTFKENYPKIHNLVVIKDTIAEYIWYLLTGALVISNSYSYAMSVTCKRKAAELQGKLDAMFENPKKEPKKQKWVMGY